MLIITIPSVTIPYHASPLPAHGGLGTRLHSGICMAELLESCLRSVEALETLVKPSYGPHGLDCLILSHSGDALMTNDGATILSSVDVQHPSGRMILDAVLTHHGRHGDNAKSFVLMVTAGLRKILHSCRTAPEAAKLGRCLIASQNHILDSMILPRLVQYSRHTNMKDNDDFLRTSSDVVRTHLTGKFPPPVRDTLTSLLLDFIDFPGDNTSSIANDRLGDLIDLFPCCCSTIDGLSVHQSHVTDGVVFNRPLLCGSDSHVWPGGHFIILKGDFLPSLPESVESSTLTTSSISRLSHWQLEYAKRVAAKLQSHGVTLLVLTGHCTASCVQTLVGHGIAVVMMVDEEDAKLIADHLHLDICSITGMFDFHPSICCKYESAELLVMGKEDCVNIKGVSMKHLVVCAPARGLAKVYYTALHNALKCLRMWAHPLCKSTSLLSVRGGGMTELLISNVLEEVVSGKDAGSECVHAVGVLQSAVQSIPRALINNSPVGHNSGRSYLLATCHSQRMSPSALPTFGVDQLSVNGINGSVDTWESLYSKYCLLQSVINLLGQLCRIETVVSVRHLPVFK